MKRYWLGVVRKFDDVKTFETRLWWCLPRSATEGDRILMYCPLKASIANQGVFAECELINAPSTDREWDQHCSEYGRAFGKWGSLGYTRLRLIRKFEVRLTAKEMKRDDILKNIGCVRRSFQGTTFSISIEAYERIIHLSQEKLRKLNLVIADPR